MGETRERVKQYNDLLAVPRLSEVLPALNLDALKKKKNAAVV